MKWYPTRDSTKKIVTVGTERKVLLAGDYCLKGEIESCLIERKASLEEISNNLLGEDYARAMIAFQKLADATNHPYLLLECTTSGLGTRSRWVQEPARVVDALYALTVRFGFRILLVGQCVDTKQKRTVGDQMLRLMLAHKYQQEMNYGCDTAIARLSSELEQRGTRPKGKVLPA